MVIDFINNKYLFSLYKNLVTVDAPSDNIDINQLIEIIRYGYVKDIITILRSQVPDDEYKAIKKDSIPCVTLSGIFNYRSSEGFVKHSGLMQIDIDKVENYDTLFRSVCDDSYTYVCFRSPGGKGLKAVIKIKPTPETHRKQFNALEIYFKKQYGVEIDSQCKDLSRCMLLSYDPDLYCNPTSSIFTYIPKENKKSTLKSLNKVSSRKFINHDASLEAIENVITELEKRQIDITSTHENWIKVGFALCTGFGEGGRGYYHRIGRMYPHYTPEETDKTYTQLLAKNNGKTGLGTLIFLAKEAGIKINKK